MTDNTDRVDQVADAPPKPTPAALLATLRDLLADLDAIDDMFAAIFAAATGQAPEQVAAWERLETTFASTAAVAVGLAHSIVPLQDLR